MDDTPSQRPERRHWPIAVTVSTVYQLTVTAPTLEAALARIQRDELIHETVQGADDCTDSWHTAEHSDYNSERVHGPVEKCLECGAVPYYPDGSASHQGACSQHIHRARLAVVVIDRERVGYRPDCSCGAFGPDSLIDPIPVPPGSLGLPHEEAAAVVREHVQDRPHSMNFPLGITDDVAPPRRRAPEPVESR